MRLNKLALVAACSLSILAIAKGYSTKLPDGTVAQVEELPGVPKWHLFPHLWSYNSVDISCPDKQVSSWSLVLKGPPSGMAVPAVYAAFLQEFEVFFAQDEASLYEKIVTGDTAWCGLERLMSGHRNKCSISITPFQTTYVGVVPSQGVRLFTAGIPLPVVLYGFSTQQMC